jgi:hypothetical protein
MVVDTEVPEAQSQAVLAAQVVLVLHLAVLDLEAVVAVEVAITPAAWVAYTAEVEVVLGKDQLVIVLTAAPDLAA